MATKEHSYKNYPIVYKIQILNRDILSSVKSIEGIESSLDYPELNEFRINEVVFTLNDPDNEFNPQKDDNFYKTWGTTALTMIDPPISESGYRSPVTIEAGFLVNGTEETELVFSGQILNVHKNAKTGDVQIVCSDQSQKIRDDDVTEFGLEKKMIIEGSGGNLHGNYPFFIGLTEPSTDSVEGTGLTRKQVLRTEGALDENNFRELATGIETEGGLLDREPTLTFQSPYRSRTIEFVVKALLTKFNITESDIRLPIASNSDGNYFSNLGRPGYTTSFPDATGAIDFGQWQWPGTVTDMIADDSDNDLYLLVSQTGSRINPSPENITPNPKPRIIKWDLDNDNREILTVIREQTNDDEILEECWRFVANNDFSIFYVLGTQPVYINATRSRDSNVTTRPGFEFGSYDSSEYNTSANSKVVIYKMTKPSTITIPFSWTRETYVDTGVNDDLFPQLAMHYHTGFSRTDSTSQNRFPNRQGNLPDSRRNFYLSNDGTELYYPYANRTQFGVAKATGSNTATKIITANRDEDGFNMSGFDFWIDEDANHVFLAYTNIKLAPPTSESTFKIIRKDLP